MRRTSALVSGTSDSGGVKADDAKRLKELEGENARLAPTPRTGKRVCR